MWRIGEEVERMSINIAWDWKQSRRGTGFFFFFMARAHFQIESNLKIRSINPRNFFNSLIICSLITPKWLNLCSNAIVRPLLEHWKFTVAQIQWKAIFHINRSYGNNVPASARSWRTAPFRMKSVPTLLRPNLRRLNSSLRRLTANTMRLSKGAKLQLACFIDHSFPKQY